MKTLLITLLLITFTNCLIAQEDSFKIATARVDGVHYKAVFKVSDGSITIRKQDGTIVNHFDAEGLWRFKFIDFNRDGYRDLFIEYISNVPGANELLLYNKKLKKFVRVDDFDNFFNASMLGNTKLYYSYERAGCADLNWNSDLFKIVNYKAIRVGNISGLGCEGDEKLGVFVSKVNGEKELQIKKYPIDVIKKYKEYKWGFIKQYWTRNYRKFL